MLLLEFFIRSAGATAAVLLAILLIRDMRDVAACRWGAAFVLACASAMLIHTAEGLAPPPGFRAALLPLSTSWIVLLWIAARSFFEDNFRLTHWDGFIAAIWLGLGAFNFTDLVSRQPATLMWADMLRGVMSYAIVGHIVFVVLNGRNNDLIESRRRSRTVFVLSLLAVYLLNKAGEAVFTYGALPLWFTLLLYSLVAGLLVFGLLALIRIDKTAFGLRSGAAESPVAAREISAADRETISKLLDIVQTERAYLEPDLSIAVLATRVGVSQHALRAIINQAMGFRNFRAFLNSYRIKDAIAALHDPAKRDISILAIAMDCGFGSLASFNRAFKQETGMAPSEMRNAIQTGKMILASG